MHGESVILTLTENGGWMPARHHGRRSLCSITFVHFDLSGKAGTHSWGLCKLKSFINVSDSCYLLSGYCMSPVVFSVFHSIYIVIQGDK